MVLYDSGGLISSFVIPAFIAYSRDMEREADQVGSYSPRRVMTHQVEDLGRATARRNGRCGYSAQGQVAFRDAGGHAPPSARRVV